MSNSLPPPLQGPEFQRAIVGALQQTYEISRERHDPSVGDDRQTFGFHIYKSGAFYLEPAINAMPQGVAVVVQHSLAMRIGPVELRHHKLGDTETDRPETSFPGNSGPAARMAGRYQQLELGLPLDDPTDGRVFFDWVIGSYGNPDEGLRAVRLQAVGSERALNGQISHWEAVYTLFDASAGLAIPWSPMPREEAVVIPEPTIRLHVVEASGRLDHR